MSVVRKGIRSHQSPGGAGALSFCSLFGYQPSGCYSRRSIEIKIVEGDQGEPPHAGGDFRWMRIVEEQGVGSGSVELALNNITITCLYRKSPSVSSSRKVMVARPLIQ